MSQADVTLVLGELAETRSPGKKETFTKASNTELKYTGGDLKRRRREGSPLV